MHGINWEPAPSVAIKIEIQFRYTRTRLWCEYKILKFPGDELILMLKFARPVEAALFFQSIIIKADIIINFIQMMAEYILEKY